MMPTYPTVSCLTRLTIPSYGEFRQKTDSELGRIQMAARPWRTFVMISIGVFASLLDLFIVNIAFPDLQRDFHAAGLAQLSWVLNGYAIVFAALLVPAGRLVDLYGRKRGFVIGLSLFTLASAVCAVAPSVGAL